MALTEIGEIGVWVEEREIVLRPSLVAMTRLGSQTDAVRAYVTIMADEESDTQFAEALAMVYACTPEDDLTEALFGFHEPSDSGLVYREGIVPREDILFFAQVLAQHGMVGDLPPPRLKGGEAPEQTDRFDARGMVAMAMAHLGASSEGAWNMTMTELIGALRAKFPDTEYDEGGAPTKVEMEAAMEHFERIKAKRERRARVAAHG